MGWITLGNCLSLPVMRALPDDFDDKLFFQALKIRNEFHLKIFSITAFLKQGRARASAARYTSMQIATMFNWQPLPNRKITLHGQRRWKALAPLFQNSAASVLSRGHDERQKAIPFVWPQLLELHSYHIFISCPLWSLLPFSLAT